MDSGPFKAPLMSKRAVTDEDRFGVSRKMIDEFKSKLTQTRRNGIQVRAKWEIEFQEPDQLEKTREFLYEILANKVII